MIAIINMIVYILIIMMVFNSSGCTIFDKTQKSTIINKIDTIKEDINNKTNSDIN
jgi:hypothetical protein